MTRFLLSLTSVLLYLGISSAQMTPQYSMYATESGDSNNNIYISAVVDGTTTNCNQGCNYAEHNGNVYVKIGSSSGIWVSGPYVNPTSYVNVTNQKTIAATPGASYLIDTESTVDCTIAGALFSSFLDFDIELAYTKSQYIMGTQTSIGQGAVSCGLRAWCSNGTPVCNPTIVDQYPPVLGASASCWPYYNSSWLAERSDSSQPWRCIALVPGQNSTGTNDATQKPDCTVH
jgi:hypothetical protein